MAIANIQTSVNLITNAIMNVINQSGRNCTRIFRSSPKTPAFFFLSDFNRNCSFDRFQYISNIKFHENPTSWSRVVSWVRTDRRLDRYGEANTHFPQLEENDTVKTNQTLVYTYMVTPDVYCFLLSTGKFTDDVTKAHW